MSLMRWDPFQDTGDLMQRFNQMLGRSPVGSGELGKVDWRPAADIIENEKEYLIKAELPEVRKEDIRIDLNDGVLTIRGERKLETEHKDDKVHRVESFYGSFARSFRLPDDVDVEGIKAESKDGVLKVRLPKSQQSRPRTVEIKVG